MRDECCGDACRDGMRPRPASRRRPLVTRDAADLAEELEPLRNHPPVAIVTGPREWIAVKRQPEARKWYRMWPGMEETFCGVAVIVRAGFGPPRVYGTMAELEDLMLGEG